MTGSRARQALGARAIALVAVLSIVGGCTSAGQASPSAGASGTPAGSGTPPSESVPPGQFVNPVLGSDFPDPFAIEVDGTYYAYATEGNGYHIQVARSTDLVNWEQLSDALPDIPSWSAGKTWAPEVWRTPAGYVMYYSLNAYELTGGPAGEPQCVSYAVSQTPEGPFKDPNTKPFVCQPELGGSIDAAPFRDRDGKRYLIWKNDGNCCGIPTRFYIQQLNDAGTRLVGRVRDMGVVNDAAWETPVNSRIEAPELLLQDGTYYLFFSGSAHDTEFYAVGYATSKTVTGPYKDAPENPILKTEDPAFGPGHNAIVEGPDGKLWTLYHAWDSAYSMRSMWLDELEFEGGKPVIKGPDVGPQPAPAP